MTAEAFTRPDFVKLVTQRVDNDARFIHRAPLSLEPNLYIELGQISDEIESLELELDNEKNERELKVAIDSEAAKDPDQRLARPRNADPRIGLLDGLRQQKADLEQRIGATSVMVVFQTLSMKAQQKLNADHDRRELGNIERGKELMAECYSHCEWGGEKIDELTKDHFLALLDVLGTGEILAIAGPLAAISGGSPNTPKSVLRLLTTQE